MGIPIRGTPEFDRYRRRLFRKVEQVDMSNEQREQIARVNSQIGKYVAAFLGARINKEFHVDELRRFVSDNVNGYIAPASPDRILRDLRAKGVVNYRVVNRRQSLYEALPVKKQLELFQ